jgi:putative resolvase
MKWSVRARQQGLSYKTAWRLRQPGQLPVPDARPAMGTLIGSRQAQPSWPPGAALYAQRILRGPETWLG